MTMSKDWTINIKSTLCPYRTQGGLSDNSSNAVYYTACVILKAHSSIDNCCYMRCPRR